MPLLVGGTPAGCEPVTVHFLSFGIRLIGRSFVIRHSQKVFDNPVASQHQPGPTPRSKASCSRT